MRIMSRQKLPIVSALLPSDAAHQAAGNGNAGRRREEVVKDQRDHLRKIRHRRLAAVALPVRVGHETDRGIERQVRAHSSHALRVERQLVLQPQDRMVSPAVSALKINMESVYCIQLWPRSAQTRIKR